MVWAALAIVVILGLFAVPPLSSEALTKQADAIVIARVRSVEVTEVGIDGRAGGSIYAITLEVCKVQKGRLKRGSSIRVTTFQPNWRPDGPVGHQGQNSIPAVQSLIRAFLARHGDDGYAPLLPNGFESLSDAG